MKKTEIVKRYLLLVIGVFFIGLGIALAKHSDLGISPVSSVANVVGTRFTFLSIGNWLTLWNFTMIIGELLILRRNFKPIELLQIPISFLLGFFTDIGIWMVSVIPLPHYLVRLGLVVLGVLVLAFGISLTVISDTVMNVGEAFVNVVAKVLNKNFGNVKVVFDISCVTLSVVLSLIFFDFTVVGTREGTLITACCSGFVVKFLTEHLKEPINRILS